jgi:hypothetical protein
LRNELRPCHLSRCSQVENGSRLEAALTTGVALPLASAVFQPLHPHLDIFEQLSIHCDQIRYDPENPELHTNEDQNRC